MERGIGTKLKSDRDKKTREIFVTQMHAHLVRTPGVDPLTQA